MGDRKKYINKMSAKLKELDAEILKLEAKADDLRADVEAEYRQQITELHNKKEEMVQKLNKIQESGEDAWKELKDGIDKSWKTLDDSIKNAINKFK